MIAWLQAVAVVWGVLAVVVAIPYAITWVILGCPPLIACETPTTSIPPQLHLLAEDEDMDVGAQDRPIQDRPPAGPAKGCRVYAPPADGRRVYWGQVDRCRASALHGCGGPRF